MNSSPPVFTDFVGGKSAAGDQNAGRLDLIAPQNGQLIGQIRESGKSGVERAVVAASAAFAAHRKQPTHQRIAWLNAAAKTLRNASDELAALICEDAGKPIRMARFEVKRGAEFLELTAAALTQLGGETLPLDVTAPGTGHFGYVLQPRREEAVVSPGILTDVPTSARLWREEVFEPIAIVASFDDIEGALAMANDSEFGLQGAVFTRDLAAALRFSDDFEVGALWINEATRFRLDSYPFGGMKRSGVGREGVRYAIEEFSQVKFTGIFV